jgi:hypothetical protein
MSLFDLPLAEARIARHVAPGKPLMTSLGEWRFAQIPHKAIRGVLEKTGCQRQTHIFALLGGISAAPRKGLQPRLAATELSGAIDDDDNRCVTIPGKVGHPPVCITRMSLSIQLKTNRLTSAESYFRHGYLVLRRRAEDAGHQFGLSYFLSQRDYF